jgi:hypothetical protein
MRKFEWAGRINKKENIPSMGSAYLMRNTILFLVIFFQSCASLQTYQQVADFERPAEYARFFELLDHTVKEAGIRNVSDFAVRGFPYLRSNRFLADLKPDLNNDARRNQWVRWMQKLDLAARRKEIQNLAAEGLQNLTQQLGEPADRDILFNRATDYSDRLLSHDQRQPDFYQTLLAAVTSPSEYSTAMRVVGIYPLTSIPVTAVTRQVQDQFRKWHHAPADQLETLGDLIAYGPPPGPAYSQSIVRLILERSKLNALGVPRPTIADQKILLAMFAPVLYQDVAAAHDEIGEVVWQNDTVSINSAKPTVYYYFSHARLKGKPILQLNYVFWYSARNGPLSRWIERGPLDGLTVRVSLDPNGQPFMVDIMNNCGCYHFYVPHPQTQAKIISPPDGIDAFAPRRLPTSYPGQRLRLRIMSGWHQVDHLDPDLMPKSYASYQLVDYDRLEMLPRDDREFESIFNSKGIAKDSPRIESLVFFPMGIADIGSMRQRGHHAVVFIGRVHFDEPDIFDKNFEFIFSK